LAKQKIRFECTNCGNESPKWLGVCPSCNEWHTYEERVEEKKESKKHKVDISSDGQSEAVKLSDVEIEDNDRRKTGLQELDRVLGGGLVNGSFVLLGGDPGIGKSTLCSSLQNPGRIGKFCM